MIINAVIVTYNRKELLLRCIKALLGQTVPLTGIYIIDNASVDGTKWFLLEKRIIEKTGNEYTKQINNTNIHYFRLKENSGGAGGFHVGMKLAYHDKPDYMWIMDDDGYPLDGCLEKQLELTDRFDYIMPISLDTEKKDKLTWFIRDRQKKWTRSYFKLRSSFKNRIMEYAVPFNGLLMSRNIIEHVGWPKKEMFIWGDDFEHQYRCQKAGFKTITALDAIFYHPEDKADHQRIFFGKVPVNYSESKLRFTCLIRNSTYNYWHYRGKHFILAKFLIYTWFFLINRKLAFKEYIHYLKCVLDGIQGDFNRHKQFLS
ncbi:MAG: glycosyltransferase [Desulfobacula sp.]|uniref:glycosyltransferase n=1 Tax=Desulfobacula sp. TaxID=2593537 RepID=UPI0025C21175|nr:glycosyltransferase [Desulfobacula sp.]MCD4722727.1 glycosyltransferase [Desulfobacula sp.]